MRTVCLAIMTLAVFISTPAIAKVYKCKDASGAITYSQVPCEKGSSQKTLTTPARTAAPANKEICPLVGDVASRFHTKMRRGASAEDLINRHGSLSGINPRLLGIINYVSGFRHNDTINSQRLGQLATSKCSSGGFGNIQAADLPLDPEQQARQEYLQARKQASLTTKSCRAPPPWP